MPEHVYGQWEAEYDAEEADGCQDDLVVPQEMVHGVPLLLMTIMMSWLCRIVVVVHSYYLQGGQTGQMAGWGWLWIWLCHPLPRSTWADSKLAELAVHVDRLVEHVRSNSAQPNILPDDPPCTLCSIPSVMKPFFVFDVDPAHRPVKLTRTRNIIPRLRGYRTLWSPNNHALLVPTSLWLRQKLVTLSLSLSLFHHKEFEVFLFLSHR